MSDAFPISQDAQQAKLTTPLGTDVLGLSRFSCVEGLSELFEIRVEAVSTQANLDFSSALGLGATIELNTQDEQKRYFHGIMTEARWGGSKQDLSVYQMVLRPWLWLLTRTSDCKIFAKMTPNDIIKQVFSDHGFTDFRDASTARPKLEYCVQYRETAFNFVSRLMEHFGLYYFFEHEDGKHTLVMADGRACHSTAPGLSTVEYNPVDDAERRQSQYVETWSLGRRLQTGVFVLEDYGYKTPSTNLLAQAQGPGGYGNDSLEMFDYTYTYVDVEGNNYVVVDEGEKFAKYRLEAVQSLDQRRSAMGAAPSLFPGALVTLEKHPDDGQNQQYLLTHCAHDFEEADYRSGYAGSAGYVGNYELTPSDRQFRAPAVTRRPEIVGVQSALVVGDGEIDVDDEARILVQFYWDRKDTSSRRVRVAQVWAGARGKRGALFTPRVGDEVLVQYEDGDPDRPIVVGSVYNGTNTVPMDLPSKKVKSGIRTLSSTGGSGYNMFLFDDTAGSEKVKLRAQKDLMFKALNDEKRDILHDQTENIGNGETINVGYPVGSSNPSGGGNPPGSGEFTLNVLNKVTINVGPIGSPLTQLIMDTKSITLNVGPSGSLSQTVMDTTSIKTQSNSDQGDREGDDQQ